MVVFENTRIYVIFKRISVGIQLSFKRKQVKGKNKAIVLLFKALFLKGIKEIKRDIGGWGEEDYSC